MSGRITAAQAGWRLSRYNIWAWPDDQEEPVIANLFAGTMGRYTLLEAAILESLDELPQDHPFVERFARRGLIVNFDERRRLTTMGEKAAKSQSSLRMTICPTMGCNFDCPYCFQSHRTGKMTEEVQDQVAALADRLLSASGAGELFILWYGGEPLLAPDVIDRLTHLLNRVCIRHGAGLRAQIYTNGYLLDQAAARKLASLRIKHARITLDGAGETHDATRHLAGGGRTFARIIENLSSPIPFPVEVRFNVHAGNRTQSGALRALVKEAAEKSSNKLIFHEAEVFDTDLSRTRDDAPQLLTDDEVRQISLQRGNLMLHGAKGRRCSAQKPYDVCVDEQGRLYSCSATLALPEYAFGHAASWDPSDPDTTASAPDVRRYFLEESLPVNDSECRDCIWLPVCGGGCAYMRRRGIRDCVPWKDDPEGFVLAQYKRLGEKRRDERLTPAAVGNAAAPVLKKWGVKRAWVYGSVALGVAHAGSDVDMIVEMPPGKYLGYSLIDLRHALSEALRRKVDLHTPVNESSTESVARNIERTKVLIYES